MIPFDIHSTANLSPLAVFSKSIKFFSKTHLFFFKKDPSFERLEKSYYFSLILHKNCDNWSKKITVRYVNKLADVAWTQLATIGRKNLHLRRRFCLHILESMSQNNKAKYDYCYPRRLVCEQITA